MDVTHGSSLYKQGPMAEVPHSVMRRWRAAVTLFWVLLLAGVAVLWLDHFVLGLVLLLGAGAVWIGWDAWAKRNGYTHRVP
jgi:hypothetical protein